MNESSGFISQEGSKATVHSDILEQITPLARTSGGTSFVYSVCIKGKMFFMKQLRPEYNKELLYRSMFMKEYELGRRIDNKHIVRYESIDENADGLYLLAEYVKGWNIEEKIAQEPEFFL